MFKEHSTIIFEKNLKYNRLTTYVANSDGND